MLVLLLLAAGCAETQVPLTASSPDGPVGERIDIRLS